MSGFRLGLAVIHAPWQQWRRGALVDLQRRLGGDALRAHTTGWLLVADHDRIGQWPNERRAWLASLRTGATHCMVLNDDVHPCRGFLDAVARVHGELLPEAVVCYLGNRAAARRAATKRGSHWVSSADAPWGGGVVLPAELVLPMVRYADAVVPETNVYGDARLAWFALSRRLPVWLTVPSLMQHVGARRSALPRGKSLDSEAVDFPGFDFDATAVDWSRGLDDPVRERPCVRSYQAARSMSAATRHRAGFDWMVTT